MTSTVDSALKTSYLSLTLREGKRCGAVVFMKISVEQVCRDPQVDLKLDRLVAESEAKAEKEKVPHATKNPKEHRKDETPKMSDPRVVWKQSIQCRQCQVRHCW